MPQLIVFLSLAFSIIIAVFAVQNPTPVTVSFLFTQAEAVPVSVLVLISALLGAGMMLLLGVAHEIQGRFQHRHLVQQLRAAEKRIKELEALPAKTSASPTEPIHTRKAAETEGTSDGESLVSSS
jgi:putative membrane protein